MNEYHQNPSYCSLVLRALARYPSRIAFQTAERQVTYAEAAEFIGRTQAVLERMNLQRGQRGRSDAVFDL